MSTSVSKNSSALPSLQRRFRGLAPEERQSQRRGQLMAAGLEVFGTRGFHAAGVRDICSEAKLTERYFYESFQNREALFVVDYEAAAARVEQSMLAALSAGTGSSEDITRAGLRAVLELFRSDPRVARVVLIEVLMLGTLDSAFAVSQAFADSIERIAAALYPDLPERGLDSRLLANGLYGSTVYIAQRWTLDGFKEPLEEILEHCALFYDALAAKMSAVTPESRETTKTKTRANKPARRPARSKR